MILVGLGIREDINALVCEVVCGLFFVVWRGCVLFMKEYFKLGYRFIM